MAGNHLRSLEKRLGLQLLVRTTRRQRLTAFGEGYYARCREILALVADTDRQAETQRLAPAGILRVSAPVSFGTYGLTPRLGDYLARHPHVTLDLVLSDRVQDLVEEGIDIAIRIGELADSSLVARPLAPYVMWCCAAPGYLAQRGTPERLVDLEAHYCLGMDPRALSQWRAQTGTPFGRCHPAACTSPTAPPCASPPCKASASSCNRPSCCRTTSPPAILCCSYKVRNSPAP